MRRLLFPIAIVLVGMVLPICAEDEPKEVPKQPAEKASFGDKDDASPQNKRYLKIRNETDSKLTVYMQYRAPDSGGAWSWTPGDPAKTDEAVSFEVEAGKELDVQYKDERVAASRMRIWATSADYKWLTYKTTDIWLVPEKTDEGEHVYVASGVETYTFAFSRDKDKGLIPGDSDMPGEQLLPTDGANLPVVPPVIIWEIPDPLPPGFVLVRDLAVLPVYTTGLNATVRIKNLGHFSANVGRRLMVKKMAPGSVSEDKGPIGPLFHYSVKTFYLTGMAPGNYVAFISPGDEAPFHFNDKKSFTITAAAYADAAVLPVTFAAGKAYIKVKNLGTAPVTGTQHLKVQKLPAGVPVDHGAIGALDPNQIKAFPGIMLAAGNYKAFLTPGDAPPHHANDERLFIVAAATFHDLDVLPVTVSAGKATVKVKNIGTANAPAGASLKIQKLPGGVAVDHGPVGALVVNGVKTFSMIPLAPGNYKAYISPGDAPPHNGNDSETFSVTANADLSVSVPAKVGGMVKATIHNNGPDNYPAGVRTWHLEKLSMGSWSAIPTVGSHVIPAIANGASHPVQGTFTGNGTYRIRITSGDSVPANDVKSKVLP